MEWIGYDGHLLSNSTTLIDIVEKGLLLSFNETHVIPFPRAPPSASRFPLMQSPGPASQKYQWTGGQMEDDIFGMKGTNLTS